MSGHWDTWQSAFPQAGREQGIVCHKSLQWPSPNIKWTRVASNQMLMASFTYFPPQEERRHKRLHHGQLPGHNHSISFSPPFWPAGLLNSAQARVAALAAGRAAAGPLLRCAGMTHSPPKRTTSPRLDAPVARLPGALTRQGLNRHATGSWPAPQGLVAHLPTPTRSAESVLETGQL